MTMAVRHELLYDTEAALRLVDNELDELRAGSAVAEGAAPAGGPYAGPEAAKPAAAKPAAAKGAPKLMVSAATGIEHPAAAHLRALLDQPAGAPVGLASLPFILERANHEIQAVLANLRDSREALETATVEKLQTTSEKLKEVTSATEVAATDILDALDRAQNLVDDLDAADAAGDKDKGQNVRDLLREEIFGMMGALQFQDITTQQLSYASSVLQDMENRLLQIAKLFDPAAVMVRAALDAPDPQTFDKNATVKNATQRQSLADEIFAK
jgi:chemotaxis regulatin CheY-phosphate phosphatase CheZ